ncbi:MAG: ISL3 family transposase, partial [bacterium]
MATLLDLQGLVIYSINSTASFHEVKVGRPGKVKCCPYCKSCSFTKHGFGRTRRILHGRTTDGLPLYLLWRSCRHKCKNCLRTWSKSPPEWLVSGKRRFSESCEAQVLRILQGTSFAETTRQTTLSYGTLRRCLFEKVPHSILVNIPKEEPEISIGIDEHSRAKRNYAITVCLLKPRQELLGIIPLRNNYNLKAWVNKYWTEQEKERVSEVCIDMSGGWKKTIPLLFPNAKIVIDHFHVIKYLNDLIGQEYRLLRNFAQDKLPCRTKGMGIVKKLYQGGEYWTERDKGNIKKVFTVYPKLAQLWYWKEEVRRIYFECQDKEEARERWNIVLDNLDLLPKRTLSDNLESILNYFDKRTTNGFTEGLHTKFKLIKRYSYGFRNRNVYVKKLLLGFVNIKKLTY